MDYQINNSTDKIDSLNENNENNEEKIVKNLNSLVEEIKSKLSEPKLLLDHINKMLKSNFIQNVVFSYLQVSVFKKLKEHFSITDEDLNSKVMFWIKKFKRVKKIKTF